MTGQARAAKAMPGDTDVWIVDLAASGERLVALERAQHLLTDPETARASRITDAPLRDRWIAAHAALHLVLIERLGRRVRFAEAGAAKPRVAGWSGDFSLTHSGNLALIAIREKGRVGIDAEVRRAVRLGVRRRRLIEVAGAAVLPETPLPATDAEMCFLAAWTRLEAIAKMRATGIGALLETLGIIARGPGAEAVAERTRRLVTSKAGPIAVAVLDVERFDAVAALATSPPTAALRLHEFSPEPAPLGG